jgi:hypothetical protein
VKPFGFAGVGSQKIDGGNGWIVVVKWVRNVTHSVNFEDIEKPEERAVTLISGFPSSFGEGVP